jgi:hypothetical protein
MTATITGGSTTIRPDLIMSYLADRDSRNVYHNIIGKAEQDVSLEVDGKRYGNLELFFQHKDDAWEAYTTLAAGLPFQLDDVGTPEVNMTFAREGKMSIALTADRRHWTVEMEYREIV